MNQNSPWLRPKPHRSPETASIRTSLITDGVGPAMLLSPSHFKLALHEAIEVLLDESRMIIGGWHVEETFGAMKLARQLNRRGAQRKDCGRLFWSI